MKRVQQGFTLIELMIVVAIIGILAAIALPAYSDYTKRSHVTEGLTLASAAKASVTEFYSSNGSFPTTNASAGLGEASTIKGNAVKSLVVGTGGLISVYYNAKVSDGKYIALSPTTTAGGVQWSCKKGDVDAKFRPANCRS